MKDINIAIAEHLGWTKIELYEDNAGPSFWCGTPPVLVGLSKLGEWEAIPQRSTAIPNYCGNLERIREVELSLSDEEYSFFEDRVLDLLTEELPTVIRFGLEIPVGRAREMSASALVRAKAVLGVFENRKTK